MSSLHTIRSAIALARNALSLVVLFLAILAVLPASAQEWPAKTVRFVVPFPPGGTVDLLARLTGAKLSESLKQSFVIENKPGGSGSIGAAFAANSPADGYTFLFVFDTHAVIPSLIPNLSYDTANDLAPVMLLATGHMSIVTHPRRPYKSFNDIVKAAKKAPDTLTYATIGNGSLGHLTMEQLQKAAGIKLVHVPYKGGPPVMEAVMGDQVDFGVASLAIMTPHIRAGSVRPLAVTGEKRTLALPEVPSLAEQGFPGFSALAWWGVFAPARTPKPIIDKLHAGLEKALKDPGATKKLTDLGMDLVMSKPDELQAFLLSEIHRWNKVIRESHITTN